MVKIKRQLNNNPTASSGRNNGRKYITIHETANVAKGATAAMHAKLQANGNSRAAAWHWQVDDKEAIQSYDHSYQLWHGGDGGGNGNMNSIAVEICVNNTGAKQKKAYKNAAELVKKLMKDEDISKSNVVQHGKWSGKDCPHFIRAGKWYNWSQFLKMIDGSSGKASTGGSSKGSLSSSGSMGLVDWMNSKGEDSSFSNREKLAKQYGIKNYKGTASQNNKLLSKLKSGDKPKKKKGNPKGLGLVDWLDSQNRNSSFSAREKLANQNGINNYKGTASQNTKLLRKLTGGGSKKKKGKSIKKMAEEVIAGKHGSGHASRRKSLGISKKKYKKVRKKVNQLASGGSSSGGKSVSQMAKEIINGKGIPQGHEARRKHFDISKAKYEKVRKKVNQLL